MNFLHLVHSVDLNLGGVASSVVALNRTLQSKNHQSEIISNKKFCPESVDKNTVLLAHGLWHWPTQKAFRISRKNGTCFGVFPHGMLDPWFKENYPLKHLKKQLYWWVREVRTLHAAKFVCFTTEEEMKLARETFSPFHATTKVSGLGVEDPPATNPQTKQETLEKFPRLKNKRILLYMGRFHEKKGVDLLLNAWSRKSNKDEILVLAGPNTKDSHFIKLKNRASQNGESIVWTGMLEGDQKWSMLRMADALILPSHQENFGMVVAEALAVGTPVYLTNKVNLWREVIASNAGFVDSDDQPGINRLVDKWKTKSHQEMVPNTVSCFQEKLHINQTVQKIISMFELSKMVKASNIE